MLAMGAFGYLGDFLLWLVLYASLVVHTWCFFRCFPKKKYRKTGLAVGNGLVLLCIMGFLALIGESYYRFVCVETDAFGMSLPARRWFALNARLNSPGCRDVEWTVEKPEGVRRIAMIGDSFAYGWGIERVEDRFSDRLQTMFDQRAPGTVQVMNVAKPGWDTGGQIQPVRDMVDRYGVDEVVLCYVLNDIEKLLPRTPDFDPIRPPEPRWLNPESSCLLDHLYRRIVVPRVATVSGYHDWLAKGFADEDIWRAHQRQLYDMIRYARDRKVTFRALLLPFLHTAGEKFEPQPLHAMLQRFFETNQVPVLDLLPVLTGPDVSELMVSSYDAHPNEQANALIADSVWKAFYAWSAP